MPKDRVQPTFEEFVDAMNEEAPHEFFMRGLGVKAESIVQNPRKEVEQRVEEVLAAADLNEGARVTLKDLLMARIGGFLKNGNGPEDMSMLDIKTLGLTDDESIRNWLRVNAGVDLNNEQDMQYAHRIFEEAAEFFDDEIAEKDSEIDRVHPELKHAKKPEGIYEIFKTAAGKGRRVLVPQACALLRIAAVINFMERHPLLAFIPNAEAALDDITRRHVRKGSGRKLVFHSGIHGDLPLPLVRFERRTKTRQRIIAKLLHKPSNRAESVLDHIGFRVTTRDSFDSMRLIYLLFFHPVNPILPALNINVKEGKNALLSPQKVLEVLGNPDEAKKLVDLLAMPTLNHAELISDAVGETDNAFSGEAYRALHIVFELLIDTPFGKTHFPFEIQVIDLESMKGNLEKAPHSTYIERQIAAVKARILGNNLAAEYEERCGKSKPRRAK